MRLEGVVEIGLPPKRVRRSLGEPAVLRALMPGDAAVRKTGPGQFAFTLVKPIGPVKLRQAGQITLTDLAERQVQVAVKASNLVAGSVDLQFIIHLQPRPSGSQITYAGEIQAKGLAAKLLADHQDKVPPFMGRAFQRLKARLEAAPMPPTKPPTKPSVA